MQDIDRLVRRRQAEEVKSGQLVSANRSQVMEELLVSAIRKK